EIIGQIGGGENNVDGDKVVKQLKKAEKDDDIKAVVLRVDSPGGAVAPSQEMYKAVKRLKAKGKPVVVSMGNLAASGGYYVSAPASWIVANAGTLTGSIGVIFQHFGLHGILETVKVEETTIKSGKYKDTGSPYRPFSDTDREVMQGLSDDIYGQFVKDVAEGRGLKEEDVRQIAEGRIYTGKRAAELKLVDEIGTYDDAIAKAWDLAKQTGEPKVQLPGKERDFSLRELMRGAFQGAAQGASEGVRSAVAPSAGMQFLAPELVR
ncbi:MAG: signal peptide peptidase SppA, partial [Deltaproteobacteria bacterium]|nr:signal peptide peptidase SppA [Deltaproteobacteria bacterium]